MQCVFDDVLSCVEAKQFIDAFAGEEAFLWCGLGIVEDASIKVVGFDAKHFNGGLDAFDHFPSCAFEVTSYRAS